jgi:hypothetical protein
LQFVEEERALQIILVVVNEQQESIIYNILPHHPLSAHRKGFVMRSSEEALTWS